MMQITAILYKGGGDKVIRALFEKGITRVNMIHGRGSAIGDPIERDGLPRQFEKEILKVLAEDDQVDEVMQMMFDVAGVDRTHGGFFFVERLTRHSAFTLPDVPVEFEAQS